MPWPLRFSRVPAGIWITVALGAASLEPILVKFGFRESLSPLCLLYIKNVTGGLLALPLIACLSPLSRKDILNLSLIGAVLFCTQFLLMYCLQWLSVVLAITAVSLVPLVVAIINSLSGRDNLGPKFWFGLGLCLIGVIFTLDFKDLHATWPGILCVAAAVLSSSIYRVRMETLAQTMSAPTLSTGTFIVQLLLTLPFTPFLGDIRPSAWSLGIWLGISALLANVAFLSALSMMGSTRISVITLIQRPLIVLLAAIFLQESLGWLQILGLALSVWGIYLSPVHKSDKNPETLVAAEKSPSTLI